MYGNLQKNSDLLIQSFAYSPSSFLELTSYLIPYSLSMGLPFGFSLAILFSLGRMASNREILALGSHGVGLTKWARPVFLLSLLLSIISTFSHLEWGPENRARFDVRQKEIIWSNINSLLVQKGQLEFDVNADDTTPGLGGIGDLADDDISKISISVANILKDEWHNVRIMLKQTDGTICRILHAGEASVRRSDDKTNLILDLRDVDVEPGFNRDEDRNNRSSLYVSFSRWKNPVLINLIESNHTESFNLKRTTLLKLVDLLNEEKNQNTRKNIIAIISKGFALGFSPFFLCCFLLPIATQKTRWETMVTITWGIFVCLAYFAVGKLSSNLISNYSFNFLGWWVPNILCLFFGLYLMNKK